MNTKELMTKVVESTGVPKKQTRAVLEAAFNAMREQIFAGEQVKLQGLGTFRLKSDGTDSDKGVRVRFAPMPTNDERTARQAKRMSEMSEDERAEFTAKKAERTAKKSERKSERTAEAAARKAARRANKAKAEA